METIRIENLTFTYPKADRAALCNINLTINDGEFIVLCGKSGCGKSTLLRLLKPACAPNGESAGSIFFRGKNINELTQKEAAEKIGFVGQNPENRIVCDKAGHELAFGLESLACEGSEMRTRVSETASFFGIDSWCDKKTSELSGGEKQLLNLASVMIMQPSLLILDEPASQLDPIAAHNFLDAVLKINRDLGITVIMSEHRLEEVFPIADKVAVMEEGKIISYSEPKKAKDILGAESLFLPAPMRIYNKIDNGNDAPVTIREGRNWLESKNPKPIRMPKNECRPDDAAVLFKSVWFRYEKNSDDILKGLDLEVRKNEIYTIVGGNGAGKSTLLSIVSGINKPYRGKAEVYGKTAALPQNPEVLFLSKTVREELERSNVSDRLIDLCELGGLADIHPYDLSGGEKQRLALAIVLSQNPDILILDEPTKGMDAYFKIKLAMFLKSLKKNGMTIIMVSHDIEFCAKYADRCAMLFGGVVTSEDTPGKFFAKNCYYTTAAAKMARGILKNAVLDTDIISALGGVSECEHELTELPVSEEKKEKKKKENLEKNIPLGIFFFALFGLTQLFLCNRFDGTADFAVKLLTVVFFGLGCISIFRGKELAVTPIKKKNVNLAALLPLLLVPLTIFAGMRFFKDEKYYFISLCIILETSLSFMLSFEKRKPKAGELAVISVLCAIAVCGRAAFAPLPQFKPAAAVVIVSGMCLGGETGFLIGAVSAFVSNFFFGQGPWTPWQCFAFGAVGFLSGAMLTKLRINRAKLCIFGFFTVLVLYGMIMNAASAFMMYKNPNIGHFSASFASGFPFDLIHAVSTAFFLWIAAEPICEKLERIKSKFGLF